MWSKEELLKHYHEDRARLTDENNNAFFLVSLLHCVGGSSDMGEPFIETCKGMCKIMDRICAAFGESLSYLEKFEEHLQGDVQKGATEEEVQP